MPILEEASREERRIRNLERDDLFLDTLHRYGIEPHEMIEVYQWAKTQKETMKRMQSGVMMTIISLVVGGAFLALWAGVKQFLNGLH